MTDTDLLENRRIVWQYPAPGTPLDPPYLVLVAVEHQDVSQAEEVVESITAQRVTFRDRISNREFKLPKIAAGKLR